MAKGKVTIKDIARELGISPSTVSKALRGNPEISEFTRMSVLELVGRWNYKPDPIATSLQGGHSKTIGVIIPEIVHYFFSTVISGIEDIAYDLGYLVLFCQSNESYEREVKAVSTLLSGRADGIMVSVSKTTTDFGHFRNITENGIPIVFFDRICEFVDADCVTVDDEEGAYKGVSHLIATGCRNIVHLSGPEHLLIGRNRKNGYIRALKDHGLPFREENIIKCDTSECAKSIIPALLGREDHIDGIFAVNDLTAAEAMKIARSHGYRVPDDISFLGFTSGMISDLTDPPLTSVEQHGYQVGREAVRMMISRIQNEITGPPVMKVIDTELVVKGSTRNI